MKLYEIQHINEKYNKNKVMGEELRFVSYVSSVNGNLQSTEKQPKDWDNVRRLVGMLFLAWNDDYPLEGSVYLGEFYTPKPNPTEDFYYFFEKFNGFPINDKQKKMFNGYVKKWNYMSFDRQQGVSTFMLTLAAWEAFNNKNVVHFSSNRNLSEIMRERYNEIIDIRFEGKSPPIDFISIARDTYPLKGIRYQVGLFDDSGVFDFDYKWTHFQPLFENSIHLVTR